MTNTAQSNKRIVKNTLLLYFRMLLLMAINLYASRVILHALGVEDFGIYNVVGGVVAMFSVISGSLSAAISRFITFELGCGNIDNLKRVFSTSITIQLLLALIIVVLAESFGVWFLNTQMTIPEDRIVAANWVMQFSLFTFVINLISVPYNAAIIAHERMAAFAYVSIVEGLCKLSIAYLVMVSPIDRLVFYAILMLILAVIVRVLYGIYCNKYFEECEYHFNWDTEILKKMFGFAGWNFIGASAVVLRDQGGNIIINIFCGPSVNAARGIATQVNTAITGFVSNFMTALNPQITKSYAIGNYNYMMKLIFVGARFSFYLLLLLSLPVFVSTHYILEIWLHSVPEYTVQFVRLILALTLLESISNPLITAMLATGRIKKYQIVAGGINMMNLPIAYFLLRWTAMPEVVFIVAIVISQCCLFARLVMLRGMIGLSLKEYIKKVYINILAVTITSSFIPILIVNRMDQSFSNFLLLCLIIVVCVCISIYYIGCNSEERVFFHSKLNGIISKLMRK